MPETVFGRHAVYHLLRAGRRKVFKIHLLKGSDLEGGPLADLALRRRVPLESVPPHFFSKLAGASHQGVSAETETYPFSHLEEIFDEKRILICDGIQDPQNLGGLCRSAYMFGFGGVIIQEREAVSITPGVCKAAAGAVEYLKMARLTSLPKGIEALKSAGYWIYGADPEAEKGVRDEDFPEKVAIVIGAEGRGLGRLVRERCDILLKIPTVKNEIGSLNASSAGGIFLYEVFCSQSGKKV